MVESGAELWAAAAAAVACRYHLSSDSCQMWAPRKVWPICHTNRLYPPLLLPPPGQYVCDINANDNLPGSTVYRQYIRCHLNCQHTTTTPTPTPPSATLARAMFGCPLPAELEAEEEGKGGLAWGLRIGIEVEFRFDQIGGPCAPLFNSSEPHPLRAGTSQSHSAPCTVLRPPLSAPRPPSPHRCDPTNGDVFICLPFANQPVNNCQQGVTMPIFNYSISFALHSDPNRTTAQPAKRTQCELYELPYTLYLSWVQESIGMRRQHAAEVVEKSNSESPYTQGSRASCVRLAVSVWTRLSGRWQELGIPNLLTICIFNALWILYISISLS